MLKQKEKFKLTNLNALKIQTIFFFFRNKHIHTQGRGKWILTQKHTITPLKSYGSKNMLVVSLDKNQ